jgi:hypothetical protein
MSGLGARLARGAGLPCTVMAATKADRKTEVRRMMLELFVTWERMLKSQAQR